MGGENRGPEPRSKEGGDRVGLAMGSGGQVPGMRPTAMDRLVQPAMLQVLEPLLDPYCSESSFGFRPGRGAHDALGQASQYVAQGRSIVVDLDLEKFLDPYSYYTLAVEGCSKSWG